MTARLRLWVATTGRLKLPQMNFSRSIPSSSVCFSATNKGSKFLGRILANALLAQNLAIDYLITFTQFITSYETWEKVFSHDGGEARAYSA
jgi:hypothetical protein